ncbi:hypothetical protein GF402_05575 [Candidatus Fermentibacteria bacterium]|nr:hypothetical protein [Candidatus Fermentibacteria bacterium]
MRLWGLLLLWVAVLAAAPPSRMTNYESELWTSGDTLLRKIHVGGIIGDNGLLRRLRQNYDPSYQSVRLLGASVAPPSGEEAEVPSWAVDTLHGGGGYPRCLSVAFPGAVPGSAIDYTILRKDWGRLYEKGPWLLFEPRTVDVDTVRIFIHDPPPGLEWRGEGYVSEEAEGTLVLRAQNPSSTLWVSSIASWEALGDMLLREADEATEPPFPPDLRAAALAASSYGPDGRSMVLRARTLLTESFQPDPELNPLRMVTVRPLQEILDSRKATPLEMAVVMVGICRELGLSPRLLPARDSRPALPVPTGWDRMLVRVLTTDGREILVEPSAYLTEADYVHRPSGLWLLDTERDALLSMEPNPAFENTCREEWRLDPSTGSFDLSLACRGYFDMLLRRKLAGLSLDEAVTALAVWMWHSGSVAAVESLQVSDLFDLSTPATVRAEGRLPLSDGPYLLAPGMDWDLSVEMESQFERRWLFPVYPEAAGSESLQWRRTEMGENVLVDTCPRPIRILMRFDR